MKIPRVLDPRCSMNIWDSCYGPELPGASRSAQLSRLAAGFTEAVRGNGRGLVHTLTKRRRGRLKGKADARDECY